ncbi:ArpU family transcriptional regulator [Bacillus atrophaeus]|uniref:ArpU family phage packaging/lysis transcriptional regulator n=1 Tax=Bacillus atrophaeus TaxID=1452 RepID=UPI000D083B8C|nr:ArpU family phage packaging/lysis transcriptional regulator [Bacillus atrophaeus]MCY9162715.1 ArpU family transcriptional regulator [Bacillus atrophaeus]MEC0765718.1 ArpU family phage packaging/lysis transcriptional regulator [Bacillus atrophaeus]MEC0781515.1 ArpU family phage packaging/lysis transcriptional regulator [Bacillus atrophaeus]MEC0810164.1 ArpU family phage packaging/lysis transcriptional regulator [Bacillus atrophaeus]MEC0935438.1 ArpU family phage packaging/lysis transcription
MQAAKQLSFIPEVNEKEVRNIVIKELKTYRSLKIQAENRKEQKEKGVIGLFPQLRKSTEYNELKVKQMDRALKHCLDQDEHSIIEKKYLSPQKIKDLEIMIELGLKRDKFYQVKRQAIYNIATALGII